MQSEDKIHMRVVAELRESFRRRGYAKGAAPFFHCPNEGKFSARAANKRALMGVSAGVPDLVIVCPIMFEGTQYNGLALELKTVTGNPTAAQTTWLEYWQEAGFLATVTRGEREAATLLQICGLIDARQAQRFDR